MNNNIPSNNNNNISSNNIIPSNNNIEKKKLKFKSNYYKTIINMIIIIILIIAALNSSLSIYNINIINIFNTFINTQFKVNLYIDKIIYILIGLSALYITFKRDTWLPFLGETIIPDILIPFKIPTNYNKTITINTEPNSKIIYWAALPHDKIEDVTTAYDDYSNSGCVLSNNFGEAKLFIIDGSSYSVPFKNEIKKHVHYRVFNNYNNMLGKVNTLYY